MTTVDHQEACQAAGQIEGAPISAPTSAAIASRIAPRPGTGLDYNWLAVGLILIALPATNIIAAWRGLPFEIPAAITLGLVCVGYFSFHRYSKAVLARPVHFGLSLMGLSLVLALIATTGIGKALISGSGLGMTLAQALGGLALAMMMVYLHRRVKRAAQPSSLQISLLSAMIAVAGFDSMARFYLLMTTRDLVIVADTIFIHADELLGLDKIYVVARLAQQSTLFHAVLFGAYQGLGAMLLLAAVAENYFAPKEMRGLIFRFFVTGCLGLMLYYLVPVVGPRYVFGDNFAFLNLAGQSPAWGITATTAPRNCMPSLHATWVILIYLSLSYAPIWQRLLSLAFIVLTLAATIGLGEHYAIDWLAAPPLVLLVRSLTSRILPVDDPCRIAGAVLGVAFLTAWATLLRRVPEDIDFVIPFALFATASFILPLLLEARLAKAERGKLEKAASFARRQAEALSPDRATA